MRICYISLGTFRHIDAYLDYFSMAGHDVHFISLTPGPRRQVPTYNTGLGKNYNGSGGKWKYPFSMLRARQLLREIRPDIVHSHYATSAGLAAVVCGFHPAVVTVHGSDLIVGEKSVFWKPVLKKVFDFADCINVVSQDLGDRVVKLGIDAGKIEIVTPGIDTAKFTFTERPRHCKYEPLRLVCTRRLEPVFDHKTIIKALAMLKKRNIPFRMAFIGDGSLADSLRKQVNKLGLVDSVEFKGHIPNGELTKLLARSDVYLSASLWDGASLSLFEAMAAGLFPIVSDINANTAWITNGVNGLLHKTGDADNLANCIGQFYNDGDYAALARWKNRAIVLQKADRNDNMRYLELVYQKLIQKTDRVNKENYAHTIYSSAFCHADR
jgi:L-malate glycosyltransferase